MTEETQLISGDQKKIAIKDILIKNKKSIIFIIVILLIGLFGYFFYIDHKKNIKIQISEQYNSAIIGYENNNQNSSIEKMRYIIEKRDSTYSPLALYFLLDNKLLDNKSEINLYFDLLINETKLDNEVKNLIIYKKGLYNSENASEEELLSIYKPLINNENLWKSHALYVIAEYFFSKNEKQKSKEFFNKIISLENANNDIAKEAQKRLIRDLSE